jgi:hypothetical protein
MVLRSTSSGKPEVEPGSPEKTFEYDALHKHARRAKIALHAKRVK